MFDTIIFLVKIYPFFYYLILLYRTYEYIGFFRRIYSTIVYIFTPNKKKDEPIDEIYEIILETEPGELETELINDTGYVRRNEDKVVYDKYFNPE